MNPAKAAPQPASDSREPERRLDVDTVLEAALRLIDAEGLGALTIRRLADELGMGAMSLYRYVRTKEEIVEGVYGLALDRLSTDVDPAQPWDEQLTVAIRHLHATLQEHPGVVELLIARSRPGQAIDRVRETLLGILRRAGFGNRDAIKAMGAAVSCALGFALAERVRSGDGDPAEQFARLESLSADEFPYLAEAAGEYEQHVSDEAFEYALAHLVAGMRKDLESA
jgi:AcrR family transcriptional regulator